MAEGKKTFIFYSDWINMIKEMPDEAAGQLLKHILSYVNDENPISDNIMVKMAFGHMKPLIKSDLKKWEGIREKRVLYGKKGGLAKAKQTEANAKQVEAVNDNVNDNVNNNNDRGRFTPPTQSQVFVYLIEKVHSKRIAEIESEKFFNHYTSNDWKVGKNKMKDWQAAARGWIGRIKDYSNNGYTKKSNEVILDHPKNIVNPFLALERKKT